MSADSLAGHVQNFFFILKVMVPHATVAIHCLVRLFSLLGTTVSIAWHSRFHCLAQSFPIKWHNDCSYRRQWGICTLKSGRLTKHFSFFCRFAQQRQTFFIPTDGLHP